MAAGIVRRLWFVPDYSKRTALYVDWVPSGAPDVEHSGTVSNNGFLQIYITTSGNGLTPFWRFNINGQQVDERSKGTTDMYKYRTGHLNPVLAGDTFYYKASGGQVSLFFYPIR